MPRFFQPTKASLTGSGPLIEIEQRAELPVGLMVVYSYVDVPSDWTGPSLERHIGTMQQTAIDALAKQGIVYDGGPFTYSNPFTGTVRAIAGGFAVAKTNIVTEPTGGGQFGQVAYDQTEVGENVFVYRPQVGAKIRYLLAARYRTKGHFYERVVTDGREPRPGRIQY